MVHRISRPPDPDPPERADLGRRRRSRRLQDLYNRIVNKHEDFAKLAKDNSSDDTTANDGGDMGWFQQGDWGSLIGQKVDELKDGEVSQPFQSEAGWHIIQRLGTRSSDMTTQVARDQARQAIGNRKADQAYDDFLRELRSSSYVKILVPELARTPPHTGRPRSSPVMSSRHASTP